jgi:hypothetical protein
MADWLKLIGSAKKPVTEYTREEVGFRKANKPGVRAGDRLFLYAPGGSRRIFALAEAVDDPQPDSNYNPNEEGSCRWMLRVQYQIGPFPVASGIHIDEVVSNERDLRRSLRQAGHIRLLPEESRLAHARLQERANSPNKSLQPTAGRSDE